MGVTEVLPRKTYNIKDFFARQSTLVEDFGNNFGDFRNLVCHVSMAYHSYDKTEYWHFGLSIPNPKVFLGTLLLIPKIM